MICPICGNVGKKIFKGKIMQKYMVQYFQCDICGLIYTEKPFWIEEAYEDSITSVDTGIMQRTLDDVLVTSILVNCFFKKEAKFLDYGGGYGIFTRMMRDLGYDWLWNDKYSENLVARGFEYKENDEIELISAFELFEHFEKPMEELKRLFSISKSILFSTLIYDVGLQYRNFEEWWYYVPETGQHISFYSMRTLKYIADKFNVHYYMLNKGMHLFTVNKINPLKLRVIIGTKIGRQMQYYICRKQRTNGLSIADMQLILKMRKR